MVQAQRLQFDLEWRTTLFTALLLPLLIGLGFWQLERADEKRALAQTFDERRALAPADIATLWQASADELAYRPALARGEFDPRRYLLLDNRVRQGRFGYEVIALFHLGDGSGRSLLVNRGWVAGDPARRTLPRVELSTGPQVIRGTIYVAPDEPYLLGEQSLNGDWPLVVQALEAPGFAAALGARLDREVFPWSLRLGPEEPAALAAEWPLVNASPAKHTGYAVQWFCMALALVILFLLRSSNIWQWLRRREILEN
ncbi:SURF1 family protein [Parahaliea aestuarii]|uniref:SURF1-like protein n=1 Tax=Parahaliea aestuarii TaxID=1852021 RepID=A0A5C8ZXJ2_9GAMM|nr:SURF1 family protein [Parahaliea aestuarii]TXS92312.1 SURF1 family protein [Parahaliea aestuarii]